MKREFICTEIFDHSWARIGLTDEDLARLQAELLLDPMIGDVIPQTNGARKVRVQAKGHGKRGGARVIYVDVLVQERIYLLLAYPKNELTKLTSEQSKMVARLVTQLKEGK